MDDEFDVVLKFLKAAGEPTRLRLLALCATGERTVTELTGILGQSQPRVSRHLKLMTEAGLLERHRDGHWVYFRTAHSGAAGARVRQLQKLLPATSRTLAEDLDRAGRLAAAEVDSTVAIDGRAFNRAILDFAMTGPVGRLLDIGCGQATVLTLLAHSASEVVGVDNDASARRRARQRLQAAGVANASVREGNLYRLPFADGEFDTVVVDSVLSDAARVAEGLKEAARVARPQARFLIVEPAAESAQAVRRRVALAAREAGVRVSAPRSIVAGGVEWLLFGASRIALAGAAA
ncbi:MAG: metalloregulator ArsR/SmtB family transcription factor [Pseudomonadota bacterium]